jgi:hypothetical protein
MSTQNFELGAKIFLESNKVNSMTVSEWKLQLVNVVSFCSEIRLRHEYNRWRVVLKRNVSKESYFELLYCVLHKFM